MTKSAGTDHAKAEAVHQFPPVEEASPLRLWPGGWVLYEISTRPWLYSLSKKYKRPITKLLDIPDEEFFALKNKGWHRTVARQCQWVTQRTHRVMMQQEWTWCG